jgi:predicted transcriptional regulator
MTQTCEWTEGQQPCDKSASVRVVSVLGVKSLCISHAFKYVSKYIVYENVNFFVLERLQRVGSYDQKFLELIYETGQARFRDFQTKLGLNDKTIRVVLERLKKKGLIEKDESVPKRPIYRPTRLREDKNDPNM